MAVPTARGLFEPWEAGRPCDRARLVALARSGLRGLRLTDFTTLDSGDPKAAAQHLTMLCEAAGVGLRVSWRGEIAGIPWQPLCHLDPPRGRDGVTAWPIPRTALLLMRLGPGFVLVEDRREGAVRRVFLDDPAQVRMLTTADLGYVAADRLSPEDSAAVGALAERQLFTAVGDLWVRLPVRFRHATS
ncbi:DUF5825 family protein [Kitasatospora sp. NPDC059571]|uniref:DUF5825 family protein n=1 Tax=Kitasatospora sp. NPDC059571 TaxID=3346871 RepID=UPI00367D960F